MSITLADTKVGFMLIALALSFENYLCFFTFDALRAELVKITGKGLKKIAIAFLDLHGHFMVIHQMK